MQNFEDPLRGGPSTQTTQRRSNRVSFDVSSEEGEMRRLSSDEGSAQAIPEVDEADEQEQVEESKGQE